MNVVKPSIEPIFPTPTLHSHLARDFSDEEFNFFNEQGKSLVNNTENVTSKNNYILDAPEMAQLREDLLSVAKYWFTEIIGNKTVEPYITQSWLNYTSKDQGHHKHTHANSILSGTLYIACGEHDKISFEKSTYEQIKILPEENKFNEWNSDITWFKVTPGKIILFPSSVKHYVETKKDDTLRVSLAYNIFVRGKLGKTSSLTELTLG